MYDSRTFIAIMCGFNAVILIFFLIVDIDNDHVNSLFLSTTIWLAALDIVDEIRKND